MGVTRMDLDGSGSGSPEGLVTLIWKGEGKLALPVPIVDLCRQLDIEEIKGVEGDFEGSLITDENKSFGIILFNKMVSCQRQRFTIAHELGHFLISSHVPGDEGRFVCSQRDMQLLSAGESDRRARMEVEANRFASLILMPPPLLRIHLQKCGLPDVNHIPQLAKVFNVSKLAMARAYADFHEEDVAIVVVHQGVVKYICANRKRFPFFHVLKGHRLPKQSCFHRLSGKAGESSSREDCSPDIWVSLKSGQQSRSLTEQIYWQQNEYALLMLHLASRDEEEEMEESELHESWRVGFRRRR